MLFDYHARLAAIAYHGYETYGSMHEWWDIHDGLECTVRQGGVRHGIITYTSI
jgi:hypothetical protein